MQFVTMKCPACAASVNYDNEQTSFKCSYCQNQISIIKPINVTDIMNGLNDTEQKKYSNYISILEQSMKAGNYVEAYNYCNKALEINPKSGSLWENKAICSFWLNTVDNLTNDRAAEIIAYLNASKQNDPESKTYVQTAVSISDNLYLIALYRYNRNIPMEIVYGKPAFTFEGKKQSYLCIEIMDICYQIYPRIEYLKTAVDMIIRGKVKWIKREGNNIYNSVFADSIGVNAKQKLDYLIYTIQCNEPSYTSLIIKKEPMSVMNKIFIVGGIVGVLPIVLFILYLILQLIIAFVNKL